MSPRHSSSSHPPPTSIAIVQNDANVTSKSPATDAFQTSSECESTRNSSFKDAYTSTSYDQNTLPPSRYGSTNFPTTFHDTTKPSLDLPASDASPHSSEEPHTQLDHAAVNETRNSSSNSQNLNSTSLDFEIDEESNDNSSTTSANSNQENDELQFATSHGQSIVLALSLDGLIRHLSDSWEAVVGYATCSS